MKANELMIGDWVYWNGVTVRIIHIDMTIELDRYIQPIPLTPEILEKNGWMHDKESNHWWHAGVEFVIWYDLKTFQDFYCGEITSMKFNYVHKLQHALRDCELDALVDNFKV